MVNGWGRRVAGVLASAVLTLAGAPGASAQTPVASVFGPVDMVRAAGVPVTRSWTFSVAALDPNGYSVCVANGGSARQYPPVTSARVTLNGAALFRPNDFNPHVTSLSRQAVLRASNTLTVEIQGQPGSGLTIAIHRGQTCSAPPAGNHPPVFTSTPVTSATLLEPYAYQGDPDFNDQFFNMNLVIRWEYLPGSTIFLVWSQARENSNNMVDATFGENVETTFSSPAGNVFLLKASYWFNL